MPPPPQYPQSPAMPPGYYSQPPAKSRKGLLISLVLIGVLVLGGGGFAAWWFLLRSEPDSSASQPTPVQRLTVTGPAPTQTNRPPEPEPTEAPPPVPAGAVIVPCPTAPRITVEDIGPDGYGYRFELNFSPTCADGDVLNVDGAQLEILAEGNVVALGSVSIDYPLVIPSTGAHAEFYFETLYTQPDLLFNLSASLSGTNQQPPPDQEPADQAPTYYFIDAIEYLVDYSYRQDIALSALQRQAANDYTTVDLYMAEWWSPQIASKYVGLSADGLVWDSVGIWQEFVQLKTKYPEAVLIDSTDWPCYRNDQQVWITNVERTWSSPEGVFDWCNAENLDRDNCLAKLIGPFGPDGTTEYNN